MAKQIDADPRWCWPSSGIIVGSSGTGKSSLLERICRYADDLYRKKPKEIFICYCILQEGFIQLEREDPRVKLFHLFDHEELRNLENHPDTLLILDDTIEFAPEGYVKTLYTQWSHHFSVSCWTIYHNLYSKNIPDNRTININSQITILMSSLRSIDQVRSFARQCYTKNCPNFMALYKEVCLDKKYGYLIINFHPSYENMFRLMTNLIPPQDTPPIAFELNPPK